MLLNGFDITSILLASGGFTFNATATIAAAGPVMNPGVLQTLTFTFDPLSVNAAIDPYSFELTGLAHPDAVDEFASVTFATVPEPAITAIGMGFVLLVMRRTQRRARSSARQKYLGRRPFRFKKLGISHHANPSPRRRQFSGAATSSGDYVLQRAILIIRRDRLA